MSKLAVVIPAAGFGTRMGTSKPKPFLALGDRTILWHTINAFTKVDSVCQIVVPTTKEWISEVVSIFDSFSSSDIQFDAILGGSERQYSIQNALEILNEHVKLVAVHDAVRPFISKSLIDKATVIAEQFGGAIVGVPAKDTIKKVDDRLSIIETPDRSKLWQAQTPQIFEKDLLLRAYKKANKEKFLGTDDASLIERVGGVIKMVEGDRENLKITYPVDLKIAELILKDGRR